MSRGITALRNGFQKRRLFLRFFLKKLFPERTFSDVKRTGAFRSEKANKAFRSSELTSMQPCPMLVEPFRIGIKPVVSRQAAE